MKITKNTVVSLSYELYNANEEAQMIEKTGPNDPLVFLFGSGQLLKAFEDNVDGLAVEDQFDFRLESKDAYGVSDPTAIVDVPKNAFVESGKLREDLLKIGNMLQMQDEKGNPMRGKVSAVTNDIVKMDFNHPLAGVDLRFKGSVLSVRTATADEIAHGHVHGHGGHHH